MPNNDVSFGRAGIQRLPEGVFGAFAQDNLSGQLVSQLLPPYAQLAAAGKVFTFDMSAGTAKAPVVAMPTTSPEWGLYNASVTDTLILISVSVSQVSGTSGLGLAIVGAAGIGVQTAVTADFTSAVKSATNGTSSKPEAFIDNNPTLIGGTPAWHAFAGTNGSGTASIAVGDSVVADIGGLLVAPPGGHMVGLEVVGPVGTTALYDIQAIVAMVRLD